jgi:catechol 2,3-dioxygenase-like lactoylglutathione lyase family enzyme
VEYKLNAVRVFVTDWERSLAFHSETLGMPIAYSGAEMGWAELDTGAAHLALERVDTDDDESADLVGRFVAVSLQVDDVQATYDELRSRGVEFVSGPERQPWGGTLAHFRDLDGNVLTLVGA